MDPIYIVGGIVGLILLCVLFYLVAMVGKLQAIVSQQKSDGEALRNDLSTGLKEGREETSTGVTETKNIVTSLEKSIAKIEVVHQSVNERTGDLNKQVAELQGILANPNQRGQFGESILQDIVEKALPKDLYGMQYTVDNPNEGKSVRFDCLVLLPNPPGPVGIDSKFPAKLFSQVVSAESEEQEKKARKELADGLIKSITDIRKKYIIPNVTSEFAIMFVPSDGIFNEIHRNLPGVVDVSLQNRVYIASPSTLMATLHTVRSVVNTMEVQRQAETVLVHLKKVAGDAERLEKRASTFKDTLKKAHDAAHDMTVSSKKIHQTVEKLESGQAKNIPFEKPLDTPIELGNGQ